MQQSIGDKAFFKAQTLTYLNGYQREEPNPVVKDLSEKTTQILQGSLNNSTNLISTAQDTANGTTTKLPQWVENDRKVSRLRS